MNIKLFTYGKQLQAV